MSDVWERHAGWWQDGFTDGADPEYVEQLLPLAATWTAGFDRVLDLGCGEGQIARHIAGQSSRQAAGATGFVVGVDRSRPQVAAAVERAGATGFCVGDAAELPFPDATFDAVIASLVLEHLARLDDTLAEVARVLRPDGRFVLFLNHPFLQSPGSGWIDDQIIDPPEQYWRVGAYLSEDRRLEEVDHGVHLVFHHRPLSRYVNGLVEVGLSVERMIEPAPPPGFVALAPEYDAVTELPRLLVLVTRRR